VILLPFLLLVFRMQRYAREFDENRVRIAADAGAVFEVSKLLSADIPMARRGGADYAGLQNELVFKAVSFVHSGESRNQPSVTRVDLSIRRGETLGIVGGSGAGKSTLINLLCGIYTPTEGEINVDGVSLAKLDLAQWRATLGFAGQDADLRPSTIFENIAYGEPDASSERVEEAARKASAHSFIAALPQGYQTPVGVRGMQLSGGERQRIALARALLRRPEILILDEATNAVDNLTEALIHEAITSLSGSTTLIVIAHRLSSIRDADRVIVMSHGKIIESGRPDELLAGRGAFSELSLAGGRRTG
jgi:subfamily B ATP-binding cassette protein MsbA